MDPRNWLTSQNVFQFQSISRDANITFARLQTAVQGTFLNNTEHINAILNVSRDRDMNAMFIAARIIQEQGTNPGANSPLTSGQGWNGQYRGYFNFFNIGATGQGNDQVILNGLRHARNQRMEYTTKVY